MKRGQTTHRCRECGRRLAEDHLAGGTQQCVDHPTAERVAWPLTMTWALHYMGWAHRNDRDLDEFVETYREGEFTGVARGEMALAATLFKDWVITKDALVREGFYRERREPVTPKGLYS